MTGGPSRRPVMHQEWRHLLFVHWRVPPQIVQARLPPGLSVDTLGGQAFVGLVAFTLRGVRPFGVPPLPLVSRFHEVNLRTYVRCEGEPGGVFFFSLDAASRLAVVGARLWFRLAYHFARIRMAFEGGRFSGPAREVAYESQRLWPGRPAHCAVRYEIPADGLAPAKPGTLEHFLIERYVLYSGAAGRLRQASVSHRPYAVASTRVTDLDETLSAAAGLPGTEGRRLVHYSPGVSVRVFAPRWLAAAGLAGRARQDRLGAS